jgi:hypothetical protein
VYFSRSFVVLVGLAMALGCFAQGADGGVAFELAVSLSSGSSVCVQHTQELHGAPAGCAKTLRWRKPEVDNEGGWSTRVGKGAMRLDRKVFMALLACAPATGDAASRALVKTGGVDARAARQAASDISSWTGWLVAILVIMVFAMKHIWENYEIRRIVPEPTARVTRTMIVQGPVTYATGNRLNPVCDGRYQPLSEREFDCWMVN